MLTASGFLASMAWAAAPFGAESLVAWWPLDEASGRVVSDRVGGHDGTMHGSPPAVRTRGPFGAHSLGFLSPGQKVTGSDKGFPAGKEPGSISLWFNRPPGVSNKVLFVYGSPRVKGGARGLWLTTESRLCFYFWGHPHDLYCDIKGGIAPDRWHHMAATFDGTTARLYYDGRLAGQGKAGVKTVLNGRYQFGVNLREDDGRDFLGLIDDACIYRRVLSPEEIRGHVAERAKLLAKLSDADRRAWHAARGKIEAVRSKELAAQVERLGVEEILFAVRQVDPDGHWYANFGYNVIDPERRKYYHPGGRLCRLNLRTGKIATLIDDPQGGVRDPQMHYDGRKILFAYRKGGQPYYHLHEINVDGTGLRRLTDGPWDDIEPTYLPEDGSPPGGGELGSLPEAGKLQPPASGGIIFVSSRCKRWVPCYVSQVAVLYRCDGDGKHIRQLSANVEHENTPWVLPDGRILYQRWEYVDRSQVGYHHLWTMNPDGTGQMVYFGNQHPNTVMIDAKPIPGTHKVVASFSPGHGRNEHAGVITVVDPRGGPDAQPLARPISRGRHFRDPYPLSDDVFLVAGETDILLLDGMGRTTRLWEMPAAWRKGRMKVHEPRPVRSRPRERAIASRVAPAKTTGTVFLEDVHVGRNMAGVKPGEIKKLLVLEVLPKPCNMFSGMEPLTYGGTFLLERILGTVPVEADGSAHFEVPAMRPLFFVALDERDMAVKRMQSFMTAQPGERVGCVGCHERRVEAPASRSTTLALRRPPSRIESIAGVAGRNGPSQFARTGKLQPLAASGPDVIDFPRDIQPILDKHCVACHDYEKTAKGGPMSGGLILTGDRGPMYSHGYYALTIAGEISHGRNLRKSNYPPRALGSSASPLLERFARRASEREKRLLRLWIDSGAVYAGTYAALGTGSIGEYSGKRPARPDLAWPSTRAAQAVLKRRCASCHQGPMTLPTSPSDNKRLVPWGEGPMNALASGKSQRRNPVFRFNRHMLYNLSRPAKSLLLLAPLAPDAGGYGKMEKGGGCTAVFKDTADPDYQTLLRAIEEAAKHLERIKRFDMPGFQPCAEYLREMKRFGLLPASFDLSKDRVDVYALERRYWRSQWYRPAQ